jgi:L-ascorbate metabolism protein UlaG (beta-lactamase superfamily)
MIFGVLAAIVILSLGGNAYLQHPKFGMLPEGPRLEPMAQSPHYSDGQFRNLEVIPEFTTGGGAAVRLAKYLFRKKDRPTPPAPIPSVKTDLQALKRNEDIVIWLGHSSYYMQVGGKRILVDPVFSENAAPVPLANKAFEGTNTYTAEEMPDIDYLLITHDHWDHLDYPTVLALKGKIAHVVCPLGVGSHFESWGFAAESIHEVDWHTTLNPEEGFSVHALPARHYSGRTLTRNKTLWAAFAIVTPERKIYISGDSGYGSHFLEAGKTFDGFDLAILDSGQYSENWRYVHMMPEDAARAAGDLRAKALLPAHAGKFSIAYHSWDDPFIRLSEASREAGYRLLTPTIGEPVNLGDAAQTFSPWWTNMNR